MSRDMSMPRAQVEVFAVQRRRRFSADTLAHVNGKVIFLTLGKVNFLR
jgi:hypothetical protein